MKTLYFPLLLSLFLLTEIQAQSPDNLAKNGDFELLEKNWEIVNPELGTISFEAEGGFETKAGDEGSCLLRMSPVNSTYPDLLIVQQHAPEPLPGNYTARAHFRVSDDYTGKPPCLLVNVLKPEGGYSSINRIEPDSSAAAGEWVMQEHEIEIPEGTPRVFLQLVVYGSTGHVDFDGVELVPQPESATPAPNQKK